MFRRAREQRDTAGGAESALRRSLLAALEGDLVAAERELAALVRRDSTDFHAFVALARIYRMRGELGRAISMHQTLVLRRDLQRDERVLVLLELAVDFRQGGFVERAAAAYEEVLEYERDNPQALDAMMALSADKGDFEQALKLLRRWERARRQREPGVEAELLVRMARARLEAGKISEARRALRRALRRRSDDVEALIVLGDVEAERGRNERALQAWRQVVDGTSDDAERVYARLAGVYGALGRSRDYEAVLRGRLDADPDDEGARLALARHLVVSGEREGAVTELRRALDRQPKSVRVHAALGRLLLTIGREVDAVKGYEELLATLEGDEE
jgi:lipopolysaccharide biosynthesis regulator YciM